MANKDLWLMVAGIFLVGEATISIIASADQGKTSQLGRGGRIAIGSALLISGAKK